MSTKGETSMSKTLLKVVLLAGMAVTSGSLAASADEDCNWYALTSAKQQQQNEAKACGLNGDGWTTDLKVHVAWCESVSPDEWRKAITDRQAELDKCGG